MAVSYTNVYNASNDPNGLSNRARVGGSSFTVFVWNSTPISFARQISVQSPAPVGTGTVPIHPLDSPYPIELVTPQALTMGTITLELYELYGANTWARLPGINGTGPSSVPVDLANIFRAVANTSPIHIVRVISPPNMAGGKMAPYTEEFHNCVVSSLTDGETIEVGTMEVLKQIEVNYTHITRGGINGLLANSTSLGPTNGDPGTTFA